MREAMSAQKRIPGHTRKKPAAKKPAAKKPAAKPVAAPTAAVPAVPSTAAAPGAKTALNPAAAWPFPTGSRP